MPNKKGGIAVEEITGILLFMFVAIVAFVFFAACSVYNVKTEYEELKFSKDEIKAIKDLNFFLEMPVSQQNQEKKVLDLIVESSLNNDFAEFDKIAKDFFSKIYSDWTLIIFKKDNNNKILYMSRDEKAIRYVSKFVAVKDIALPIPKGEDFEFVELLLYIYN